MNTELIDPISQARELFTRRPLQISQSLTPRIRSSKNLETVTIDFSILPTIGKDSENGCAAPDCKINLCWYWDGAGPDYVQDSDTGLELRNTLLRYVSEA